MQEIGQHDFDAFAGPKDTSVPSEWFSTTLDALTELARPIRNYVNRRIAHIDAREVPNPEIAILDAVIDAMSEATVKLSLLLTATDLLSPQPTIQFDWAEGLEVPWLHQDRQQ